MPRRYDSTAAAYRLTCATPGCTSEVLTAQSGDYRNTRDDIDLLTGRPVHAIFASRGDRGGNQSRCRECVRQQRARRAANAPRVPGSAAPARLVTDRRFGVELELIFPYGTRRETISNALAAAGVHGWRVKSDGSLSGSGQGWEIVSPALLGDSGREQVRTVCRVLRDLGAQPNRSCGMHVHHEIRDLTIEQVKTVASAWATHQPIIDGLVSPSRRAQSRGYCRALSSDDLSYINACHSLEDLQRLGGRREYSSRFRTLNLNSYGKYGTAEIRQHQGTCDAEKILTWVSFGQALIAAAATGTVPATRASRVRDLLGSFGDHLNETARTFLLGRAVEFNAVAV